MSVLIVQGVLTFHVLGVTQQMPPIPKRKDSSIGHRRGQGTASTLGPGLARRAKWVIIRRTMGRFEFRSDSPSWLVYVLVAVIAFTVFLPWVRGYFLGDDWMLFARNSGWTLPDELRRMSDVSNSSRYRPLSELTLGWAWSALAFNTVGHHLVSYALHALTAVLVAVLAQRLAHDRRVSLLAGLSFAVLGCHTEAVVWMTARHEMLVTACALLSMISYVSFRESHRWIWWACAFLAYIVSFGFKENALMLPLLLVFYDFIFTFPLQKPGQRRLSRARQLIPLMPPVAVGIAYLLFRLLVGGGYNVPFTVLALPKNLIYYLLMETVALPASTKFLSRFPFVTLPVIVTLAIACALCVWFARDRIVRGRVVWFGTLWMVFALAPVILMVAERTTYLSSVGWALAISSVIVLMWDTASDRRVFPKRWLAVLVVVVILVANLVTLGHRSYWWNRAAYISYDMFSHVRAAMQTLPPGESIQLWFINVPDLLEYASAFGDRIHFAVWLMQNQTGAEAQAELFQNQEIDGSPREHMRRLVSERAAEGPVLAFYWQGGILVESTVSQNVSPP